MLPTTTTPTTTTPTTTMPTMRRRRRQRPRWEPEPRAPLPAPRRRPRRWQRGPERHETTSSRSEETARPAPRACPLLPFFFFEAEKGKVRWTPNFSLVSTIFFSGESCLYVAEDFLGLSAVGFVSLLALFLSFSVSLSLWKTSTCPVCPPAGENGFACV